MSAVDDDKREMRAVMRRRRAAIGDRTERAGALWERVFTRCRRLKAQTVMVYVGVGAEPDTTDLIAGLIARGIRVALPRIEGDDIVAVLHDLRATMAPGGFGIPAPVGAAIDPITIDVAVVPGLAFTWDGRRLGQGGGYYDRFLPLLRPDCEVIGVCFAEQIVDDLPTAAHDRIVDLVVSDDVPE